MSKLVEDQDHDCQPLNTATSTSITLRSVIPIVLINYVLYTLVFFFFAFLLLGFGFLRYTIFVYVVFIVFCTLFLKPCQKLYN